MNLDDFSQAGDFQSEDTFESSTGSSNDLDARRRLEDKIEEMRLKKEMQEFDFDI